MLLETLELLIAVCNGSKNTDLCKSKYAACTSEKLKTQDAAIAKCRVDGTTFGECLVKSGVGDIKTEKSLLAQCVPQ